MLSSNSINVESYNSEELRLSRITVISKSINRVPGPGSLSTTGLAYTGFALGPLPGQGTEELIWNFSPVSSQGVLSFTLALGLLPVDKELEMRAYSLRYR